MQFAALSGDPRTGAYTQIRRVPALTANPLHSHSNEIKNVIISGVWYTGADVPSARDFGPGSVQFRGRLSFDAPTLLRLIRFRGQFPRGGYDVHDGRHKTETASAQLH